MEKLKKKLRDIEERGAEISFEYFPTEKLVQINEESTHKVRIEKDANGVSFSEIMRNQIREIKSLIEELETYRSQPTQLIELPMKLYRRMHSGISNATSFLRCLGLLKRDLIPIEQIERDFFSHLDKLRSREFKKILSSKFKAINGIGNICNKISTCWNYFSRKRESTIKSKDGFLIVGMERSITVDSRSDFLTFDIRNSLLTVDEINAIKGTISLINTLLSSARMGSVKINKFKIPLRYIRDVLQILLNEYGVESH